jgi:precorrin-6B methylase 2
LPAETVIRHLTDLYRSDPDPWRHRTSPYERQKYARTLAAAGSDPVDLALEIGSGNGSLTRLLAERCGRVIGVECIAEAQREAERHLSATPNATVLLGTAPGELPDADPDLVVLSEVLYFLTCREIRLLADWIQQRRPARVVAVNWTGETEEDLSGDAAAETFLSAMNAPSYPSRFDGYRLDVLDI